MSQDPSKSLRINYAYNFKTLESFSMIFSEENDHHKKTKILCSFIQELLSTNNQDTELSFKPFLEVISKVLSLCKTFLKARDLSSSVKGDVLCEEMIQNIESACQCFDVINKLLDTSSLKKIHLQITRVAFSLLCLGYTHCQDSEMIYGELLEQLENQLGMFFKKIESLQTITLRVLDMFCTVSLTEDESVLNSLLSDFGNLCQIVSAMQASAAYDLWTSYTKFFSKHSHLLQNFDISHALACLISLNCDILQSSKCNLNTETGEDEETNADFCFYVNALVDVLKIYQNKSKDNILELKIFISNLFEYLILCFSPVISNKTNSSNVNSCLTSNTYSILCNLYKNKDALQCIELNLAEQTLCTTECKESEIGSLIHYLCIIQFMECLSMQLRQQLFFKILFCLNTSKFENDADLLYAKLPKCTVTETNSNELVTLYDFAYDQMCEVLKSFPGALIREMNHDVFLNSSKCSDVGFLLMSDVWVYRLRCESIDFLKDICHSTLKEYTASNKNVNTENFLKRILNFLPESYKNRFLEEFPTLHFHHGNDSVQHRYGTLDLSSSDYELNINCEQNIKEMISSLNECDTSDVLQLIQKACLCLELCAAFINMAETCQILEFIEFASQMFKTEIYEIQIAVLTFIKALSRKQLQEQNLEFSKILKSMAELFTLAIHSKNYIVQIEALNTFSYFANRTPHVRIVQDTLKQDLSLKPLLKCYISPSPDKFLMEKEKMEQLQRGMMEHNGNKFEISQSSKQTLLDIFCKNTKFM